MELSLSSDQAAILDAIEALAKPYNSPPTDFREYALTSSELDAALVENGFLDIEQMEELGGATAALVVERLAKLPYAVEAGASALVRPLVGWELPRPICLAEANRLDRPIRFLAEGATLVLLHADKVTSLTVGPGQSDPIEPLFAYPMALLRVGEAELTGARVHEVSPDALRTRWRVALATEASGLIQAAIASTVLYVSERKQFGRPIAAFQAVRHRLAEAHVRANGVHWLALKAAASGDAGDAALAAYQAQDSANRILYDLHQFLGAMGITLEHPLHLWSYRLKALIGELGGRGAQAVDAAELIWA
jgi:alkylation response protein AidB-like acyl-CoA dehydrogenase